MARERVAGGRDLHAYLAREMETFGERPLSDVDSLVLSCLSYFRWPEGAAAARTSEGACVRELFRAEWFCDMTRSLWDPEGLVRLLAGVVASPRFRDLRVSDYVDDFSERAEKQFSACVLRLPGGDAYVSFRGTDNSLVGWKEDFDMAFETGVPSQRAALAYLERVAPTVEGRLFVGGHSKGGNLAVYAACLCSGAVASRICRAFSHDGPGFTAEALSSEDWRRRAHLVSKTVPRSSVIGMLFERQEDYAVVDSMTAGVAQHDPFSWVVEGTGFAPVERIGRGADFVDEGLNGWISRMTREEREGFVNALFSVLYAGGEETLSGLGANWQRALPAMLEEARGLAPAERAHITRALALLARSFAPGVELPQIPALSALLPGQPGGGEADSGGPRSGRMDSSET